MIESAGSDSQRDTRLPGIASGEARGAAELTRDPDPVVGAAEGASILVLGDERGEGARLVDPAEATVEGLDLIDSTRTYSRLKTEIEEYVCLDGLVAVAKPPAPTK